MIQILKHLTKKNTSHNKRKRNIRYLMIGIAIVMFWRGVWHLLDMYLFPDYPLWSNLICILLAIIIFLIDDGEIEELDL